MKTFKLTWLQSISVGFALATVLLAFWTLLLLALFLTGCTNAPTAPATPPPTGYVAWPADIPPLPTNGDTGIAPRVSPNIQMATSRASVEVSPMPTLQQFASRMGGSCLGLFEPSGDSSNYVIGNQCLTDYGVCCILSYNAEPTKIDTGTTNARTWEHVYLISNAEAARYMAIRTSLPQNIFATLP